MNPLPHYYKEERPWGSWERFLANEPTTVKILHLLPHMRLSLQKHKHRSEFWRVIEGDGKWQIGDTEQDIKVGDETYIHVGELHRLEGGPQGVKVLEIMLGEYDEGDIEHIEDDFGRT